MEDSSRRWMPYDKNLLRETSAQENPYQPSGKSLKIVQAGLTLQT